MPGSGLAARAEPPELLAAEVLAMPAPVGAGGGLTLSLPVLIATSGRRMGLLSPRELSRPEVAGADCTCRCGLAL